MTTDRIYDGEDRGLPPPEDVFLEWLLDLPEDADPVAAAALEAAMLERRLPQSAAARRLLALFRTTAASTPLHNRPNPPRNRRLSQ